MRAPTPNHRLLAQAEATLAQYSSEHVEKVVDIPYWIREESPHNLYPGGPTLPMEAKPLLWRSNPNPEAQPHPGRPIPRKRATYGAEMDFDFTRFPSSVTLLFHSLKTLYPGSSTPTIEAPRLLQKPSPYPADPTPFWSWEAQSLPRKPNSYPGAYPIA